MPQAQSSASSSVMLGRKLVFRRHQSQLAGTDKVMQQTDELPTAMGRKPTVWASASNWRNLRLCFVAAVASTGRLVRADL